MGLHIVGIEPETEVGESLSASYATWSVLVDVMDDYGHGLLTPRSLAELRLAEAFVVPERKLCRQLAARISSALVTGELSEPACHPDLFESLSKFLLDCGGFRGS
ncbi:MAG: hypothetical protein KDA37_03110 [Planctomycetales bacterium]|nr:hypothetical protein [Planctomycetales bacterium]